MPLPEFIDERLERLLVVEELSSTHILGVLNDNKEHLLQFLLENKSSFSEQVVSFERGLSRADSLVFVLTDTVLGLRYFFNERGIYEYADLIPVRRANGAGEHMGATDAITVVKKAHPNTFGLDTFSGLISGIRRFLESESKRPDVNVPSGYYVFKFEEQWAGGGQESGMSEKVLILNIPSAEEAFERFVHYCTIQSHKHYFQRVRMAVPERDKWFWLPNEFSVKVFSRLEIGSMLSLPSEIIHT